VPYEQAHYLSRDEIASFGIDPREFQETRWTAMTLPPLALSAFKFVVEVKGPARQEFRLSAIRVGCAGPRRVTINYFRGLGSNEVGVAKTIKLAIGDHYVSLPGPGSIATNDTFDTGGSFEFRSAYEWLDVFEAATARDSIDIIEADPGGAATAPRVTRLSTSGFPQAIAALRRQCESTADRMPAVLDVARQNRTEHNLFDVPAPAVKSFEWSGTAGGR
jgi:hypothetical protein